MARKPLCGTVAGNVLAHGTGGLNIDGSRIGLNGEKIAPFGTPTKSVGGLLNNGVIPQDKEKLAASYAKTEAQGRWPANVLLDEGAAAALDEQSGESRDGVAVNRNRPDEGSRYEATSYHITMKRSPDRGYGGSGGASRFFYVAKASRRDRNEGLDGMPDVPGGALEGNADHTNARKIGDRPEVPVAATKNAHPTVKPVALMRHLVRLVTPPGGLVLDPFTGSGSTGKAAVLEGFRFHGIEQDAEYAEIARARIAWAEQQADDEPDQPTLM